MQKWVKAAVAIALAVAAAGVGTFAVLTSTSGASPCAGITIAAQPVGPAPAATPSPLAASFPGAGPTPTSAGARAGSAVVHSSPHVAPSGKLIQVVAAENFWGSLVSQLGGNLTSVLSIVTDPNADPHEYAANASDATAIADAQYVIVNGVGYDTWALQLIAAGGNANQVVRNIGTLVGVTLGAGVVAGNPHMWYSPKYVNETVAAMYSDLVHISPSNTSTFQKNYAALNSSLAALYSRANVIKNLFAGTKVAATEDIFVYLANFTGLDLVSPPEFIQAVAEGNDPPPQSVVTFQCQLESGKVGVLVYNEQTVTPITIQMKAIAAAHNVTIVGVTETIQPPDVTFQVWMNAEYLALQNALNAKALGK
ncbi:MAG: zinc ABC transporter substrate-binding protein [Thermoplasmata archaeon]|nr:zinc ABC transporter substrate-binding protein [Thermoplasmata archaeon]